MPHLLARHYFSFKRCSTSLLLLHDKLFGLHSLTVDKQVAEIDAFGKVGDRNRHVALRGVHLLAHHLLAHQVVNLN